MATEEINYRVDVQNADGAWRPWTSGDDLAEAKRDQISALALNDRQIRDARIVELRTVHTATVLHVDAASLDILSREEI